MAIAVGDLLRIDTELVRVIFALCLLKERFPNAGPCNLKARYPINRIDRQAQAGHLVVDGLLQGRSHFSL
jgi:hypothetical protein